MNRGKNTTLRVLLQGCLGVVLLWQIAWVTPTMGTGAKQAHSTQPLAIGERAIPEALLKGVELNPELSKSSNIVTRRDILSTLRKKLRQVPAGGYNAEEHHISFSYTHVLSLLAAVAVALKPSEGILKALIAAGANPDERERWHNSQLPLELAVEFQNFEAAKCLLDQGADASDLDPDELAKHICSTKGLIISERVALWKDFVAHGLDSSKADSTGDNLLHNQPLVEDLDTILALLAIPDVKKCVTKMNMDDLLPWQTVFLSLNEVFKSMQSSTKPGLTKQEKQYLRALLQAVSPADAHKPTTLSDGTEGPSQLKRLQDFISSGDTCTELQELISVEIDRIKQYNQEHSDWHWVSDNDWTNLESS